MKLLLDAGGWRNQPEDHDHIIIIALMKKHYEIVRLLLEVAPVEYLSEPNQCELLQVAIGLPSVDVALVRLLLDKGIPTSPDPAEAYTPLHYAVQYGYFDIVQLLLERGADINAQDIDNRTPLHHAVMAGGMAMVELLLRFEPNLDLVNSGWLTPMEAARAKNTGGYEEAEIFKLLQAVTGRAGRCSRVGG